MSSARDILAAARIKVVNKFPYLSAVVFNLRPCEMEGLGTMAVDAHARLYFDPDVTIQWGSEVCAGVVFHEVNHLLRDHHGRRHDRDSQLWNLAGDAEINDDVAAAGVKLPGQCVTPALLGEKDGQTAEHYFASLRSKVDKIMKQMGKDGKGAPQVGSGKCGGCAGNPGSESQGQDAEGKTSKEGVPPPVSQTEIHVIRKQVATAIQERVKQMGRGSVPGNLAGWAERELEPPKIDWRKVLAKHVRASISAAAGAVDYSFRRLSRSYLGQRMTLGNKIPVRPGLKRPIPEVALVIDSSGSMMGKPFERALAEVMGVVKAMGVPIKTIAVDADVQAVARVAGKKDLNKIAKGFGGTDMRIGIAKADKEHVNVIVLLTDGDTPWPAPTEMPKARLITCIIGGDAGRVPKHITPVVAVDLSDGE